MAVLSESERYQAQQEDEWEHEGGASIPEDSQEEDNRPVHWALNKEVDEEEKRDVVEMDEGIATDAQPASSEEKASYKYFYFF